MASDTAQPDNTGGCMLALYPPHDAAKALTVPGGLPADDVHLTIAYAGDAADVDPEALNAAARILARRDPITATISGTGRFTGGDTDVAVALADSPHLEDLRRDALDLLAAHGVTVPRDHGYTPHLTRQYLAAGDPDPDGRLTAFPAAFTAISAVHGRNRTDYPFGGDLAQSPVYPAAREAFAAGWESAGAPVTERAVAALNAAVVTACLHEDDPDVIGDTVRLGQLEGVRANLEKRREDLVAAQTAAIMKAWNCAVHGLNARRLITRYRADVYLTDTPQQDDNGQPVSPDTRRWWRDTATAAALGYLSGIHDSRCYSELLAALTAAVLAGMAEGEADALAEAAARQGLTGFDVAAAYKAAYQRMKDDPSPASRALEALQRIIEAAAADLGRRLASMTADGASYDDMLTAAYDTAAGDNVRAVRTLADWLIFAAAGASAVALFLRSGVSTVTWHTTGAANVCAVCLANAAGSPYPVSSVPGFPAHPNCHCWLTTEQSLPLRMSAH